VTQERRDEDEKRILDLKRHAIPSVTALKEASVVFKHKATAHFGIL